MKIQDIKALEGAHFRMLRRMMNLSSDDARISREDLLKAFKMPSIARIMSQKRLRWLGHALRRPNYDRSKIAVLDALEDDTCAWTKLIKQDCTDYGMRFASLAKISMNRSSFRMKTM